MHTAKAHVVRSVSYPPCSILTPGATPVMHSFLHRSFREKIQGMAPKRKGSFPESSFQRLPYPFYLPRLSHILMEETVMMAGKSAQRCRYLNLSATWLWLGEPVPGQASCWGSQLPVYH